MGIYLHVKMLLLVLPCLCIGKVKTGLDVFFEEGIYKEYAGKKIGLITNQTGRSVTGKKNIELFLASEELVLTTLFCPEHGLDGFYGANQKISSFTKDSLPVYSLFGSTKRLTADMLKDIDLLIFDMQDIGCRSYTYITTLFYAMEEAEKKNIPVIVLDRPNPLGGLLVDGPMLEQEYRSFVGYINVPYCHGMTIGELALLFKEEYHIGCPLRVIPMKGWKRNMSFRDTGLCWIPPSPHIPETETPFYYQTTGLIGELKFVSIGIGYTLPFRVVGAPWIDAELLAEKLNHQKLKGVRFDPFHFMPFYGRYKKELCHGVLIQITDEKSFRPVEAQFLLLGMLKSLYAKKFLSHLAEVKTHGFAQACGNAKVLNILQKEKYPFWELVKETRKQRNHFKSIREKYLLPNYLNN